MAIAVSESECQSELADDDPRLREIGVTDGLPDGLPLLGVGGKQVKESTEVIAYCSGDREPLVHTEASV